MNFLFLFLLTCMGIKAINALPTASASTKHIHLGLNREPSPLGTQNEVIKMYTHLFVTEIEQIMEKVLQFIPNDYEKSRQHIEKFLKSTQRFETTFANCNWNIMDLNHDITVFLDHFTTSKTTVENEFAMQLLKDFGFKDLKQQVELILVRFVNGELGPISFGNDEYC